MKSAQAVGSRQGAASPFRAGDVVHHAPSGETWVLAAVGEFVYPAGWPMTAADPGECRLVRAATDEAHHRMVQRAAAMRDRRDVRCSISRRLLEGTA